MNTGLMGAIYTNADNLKLPICPKCNETNTVKQVECVKLLYIPGNNNWYTCSVCNIDWCGSLGIFDKSENKP